MGKLRRAAVAALLAGSVCTLALAQAAERAGWPKSFAETIDPRARNAASAPQRLALLDDGERALRLGDAAAAQTAFDAAAQMLHAADAEIGLVRAALQAGEYRRALAFCAHTAGAHRDTTEPAALYAWLLRAGGQEAVALRVLDETLARAPSDALALELQRQIRDGESQPGKGLRQSRPRLAPYASTLGDTVQPTAAAQTAGSAVLIDNGRAALVPLASVAQAKTIWLRNGLGQTVSATMRRALPSFDMALLDLNTPLDAGASPTIAARGPFAGSPGFVADYGPKDDYEAAWPMLRAGFLGGAIGGDAQARRLGIEMPGGAHGGPVFDSAGRLAGIASHAAAGDDRFMPLSALRSELGAMLGVADDAPSQRMPLDEAYERAMRIALQVIVER